MPQKPLDISTSLFYPRAEEQQASLPGEQPYDADAARIHKSVRVCSHMVHHKIPRTKLRGIFLLLVLRELPFVHHWGQEWLAVEATAACGGNREPEQAQRSQRTSPAQGVQADAVTASRRPAVRPAGQKQSSRLFLERGGFYASPRICLISAKSAAK